MDTYDEDLTENVWYNTLCLKHKELFRRATNERWMNCQLQTFKINDSSDYYICIPQIGSWKNSIEDGDLFSQKCFESHILKPVLIYSSDGIESSTESNNKYITYNGKEVIIKGSKIFCVKGFNYNYNQPLFETHSENLLLNVESCHTSTILFEETFFNQNDESYPVLCLSDPLEPHLVIPKDRNKEETSSTKAIKNKWENSYLWQRANHPKRLRQLLEDKIKQFVFPNSSHMIKQHDFVSNQLKLFVDAVTNFQTICLQIALRDSKLKKSWEIPTEKEAVKHAVEEFIMHGIGRTVRTQLNELFASQDGHFNKLTRNLSSITPSDLGIKDIFSSSLPRAGRELTRLNRCSTASDKLACLHKAILHLSCKPKQILPTGNSVSSPVDGIGENAVAMETCRKENTAMSSDDLLPILIYLIIKSDINNWLANFYYVKHFHLTGSRLDQSGFYIATLEAALEHVKNGNIEVNKFGVIRRSDSGLENFFNTLKSGDVDKVKRLLRQAEAMRDLQEHDKCHPLCECSKCQHLSDRNASEQGRTDVQITIGSRDDKGRTPLHIAAITGKHELVEALITQYADLNSSDYHGATPLHLAAQEGNQSAIFLLLHYGAIPNAQDNNKNTPLHLACLGGHDTCVKALLFYDPVSTVVKVNAANDVGDTPLFIASKWGYVSIVTCLMEYGANPHQSNRRNLTPFNISHSDQISFALRNTEITNSVNPSEPQREYSSSSKKSVTKRVQAQTLSSIQNKPPTDEEVAQKQIEKLLRAVTDSDINMVKYVCGWDSQPKQEHTKCHPLCQCFKCQPPVQDIYLHANSSDAEGMTPLIIASKRGDFDMVKLLLEHNAKVDVKTKVKGHSPLHLAAQYGHYNIIKSLLAAGAAYDVRDGDGNTPMYMCAMNGHRLCAELLLKAGASLNLRNHRGDSPLHEAVRWKHGSTACLLIEHGALGYYKNCNNHTALDLAAQDVELRQLLQRAFDRNDIWQHADTVTSPSGLSPARPPRRKSLRQVEADKLLESEICNHFHAAPATPPMIDVSFDQSKVFDFNRDATNSFVDALSSSTPEKNIANDSIEQVEDTDQPENNSEIQSTSRLIDTDLSDSVPSSISDNVILSMKNPTFESNLEVVSCLNQLQTNTENLINSKSLVQSSSSTSKSLVQSSSSTSESSYFEISPKKSDETVTQTKTSQSEADVDHVASADVRSEQKNVSVSCDSSQGDNLYLSLSEEQKNTF